MPEYNRSGMCTAASARCAAFLRSLAIVSVSLSLPLSAGAMDLHEAWQAALQNDAMIRASRAAAEAGRERIPQARSQLLPNVSASFTRNYNDLTTHGRNALGQSMTTSDDYWSSSRTLSVRQPLYRPGLRAQLRQAEAQVRDTEATLAGDEQDLVVRVGEAYFDALLAREQLTLVQSLKRMTTVQLDAARKTFAAGSGTRTDIDDAQARLDMTLAQELEARQNVDFTRRKLDVLTGRDGEPLADLDAPRFVAGPPQPARLDDWVARAWAQSPDLLQLQAQLDAAGEEISRVRADHLPTLDAVAQWSKTDSDNVNSVNTRYDQKSIGLQLSVPLYSGGYVSSTVRQALATQTRVQEQIEATRRDIEVRIYREFREVTEGIARIGALEQAVASAEQAVLSGRKSFEAGVRTTLDVLNAEQQRTSALRDLAQARYTYLVSLLRLHALAGDDQQENVSAINIWLQPRAQAPQETTSLP